MQNIYRKKKITFIQCCISLKFMYAKNQHENNSLRINYSKELHTIHSRLIKRYHNKRLVLKDHWTSLALNLKTNKPLFCTESYGKNLIEVRELITTISVVGAPKTKSFLIVVY
jgi:hypothetical protein